MKGALRRRREGLGPRSGQAVAVAGRAAASREVRRGGGGVWKGGEGLPMIAEVPKPEGSALLGGERESGEILVGVCR